MRISSVVALCVSALAFGEIVARSLGFGSPPLSIAHPTIEYMFAPNQDLARFHRRFATNQWGMRSEPVDKNKADEAEYRVLALGDSVLNGGALTDQSELATTLLSSGKSKVLNISAGSWGPPNILAYVKEFGFFDADMTVLVVSGHDAYDVPTFQPLNPSTHPTHRPISALFEAVTHYVPRYLPDLYVQRGGVTHNPQREARKSAIPALSVLLDLAAARGPVCVILHATRHELLSRKFDEGRAEIETAVKASGGVVVSDADFLDTAGSYRDDIHLNTAGQRQLGQAFKNCIAHSKQEPSRTRPTSRDGWRR